MVRTLPMGLKGNQGDIKTLICYSLNTFPQYPNIDGHHFALSILFVVSLIADCACSLSSRLIWEAEKEHSGWRQWTGCCWVLWANTQGQRKWWRGFARDKVF